MKYLQIDLGRNYLIGIVNLVVFIFLATILAVLLIFHIKNYQDYISYSLSWQFLTFDPFAVKLIVLVTVAMVLNAFSTLVQFSEFFSRFAEQNFMVVSMCSILWIVLFLSSSFSREYWGLVLMPVLISVVIFVLSRQTKGYVTMGSIYLVSLLVWVGGYF